MTDAISLYKEPSGKIVFNHPKGTMFVRSGNLRDPSRGSFIEVQIDETGHTLVITQHKDTRRTTYRMVRAQAPIAIIGSPVAVAHRASDMINYYLGNKKDTQVSMGTMYNILEMLHEKY